MGQAQFRALPGIVLAGGRSLRMGRPKALLPWPGSQRTFAAHVTDTLRTAGLASLAVVTGEHHDLIVEEMQGTLVTVLHNPRHAEGQLTSLLHGLRWAFSQTSGDWTLATLVDVPAVHSSTVVAIAGAARAPHIRAVRPAFGDRHGHPVVWHRDVLPLLECADLALGARAVVHALAAQGAVLDVAVDDPGVLTDIDTPADYARLLREA